MTGMGPFFRLGTLFSPDMIEHNLMVEAAAVVVHSIFFQDNDGRVDPFLVGSRSRKKLVDQVSLNQSQRISRVL